MSFYTIFYTKKKNKNEIRNVRNFRLNMSTQVVARHLLQER